MTRTSTSPTLDGENRFARDLQELGVADPVSEDRPLPAPPRRSTWTFKQKLARVAWGSIGRLVWILAPSARPGLIRLFGGKVGPGCVFARDVDIIIPWNLDIGAEVQVGSRVILYSLGPISLGENVVLDYKAHLCAGTHDFTDPAFPLVAPPVRIGSGCFVGMDAYIGPGVVLGPGCRVWPRASVYRNWPAGTQLRGNPARAVTAADEIPDRERAAAAVRQDTAS